MQDALVESHSFNDFRTLSKKTGSIPSLRFRHQRSFGYNHPPWSDRTEKIKDMTLNASAYNAPKDARRAYEKGIEAEKHGKLADARQSFEKAVEIYPKYTNAWFVSVLTP
ncbi:MAG: hypothetical protein DMG34_07350 [Acidobacteria bacterium]|nr:MAG: hypothetical protein DMG34_07350 [Acidobacteriota bacterium]